MSSKPADKSGAADPASKALLGELESIKALLDEPAPLDDMDIPILEDIVDQSAAPTADVLSAPTPGRPEEDINALEAFFDAALAEQIEAELDDEIEARALERVQPSAPAAMEPATPALEAPAAAAAAPATAAPPAAPSQGINIHEVLAEMDAVLGETMHQWLQEQLTAHGAELRARMLAQVRTHIQRKLQKNQPQD